MEMGEEDQEPDHAHGSSLRQLGLKPPYVDIYVIMVGDLAIATWTKLCPRYS